MSIKIYLTKIKKIFAKVCDFYKVVTQSSPALRLRKPSEVDRSPPFSGTDFTFEKMKILEILPNYAK